MAGSLDLEVMESVTMGLPSDAVEMMKLLAHKLCMKVVVEGVQMKVQLKHLLSISCENIQGYQVCRPPPANQVEAFICNNLHMVSFGTIDL